MDDVQAFAAVMAVIITSIASLAAIALGSRFLWRAGSRQSAARPSPSRLEDERLERIEQAIDAIAIEVERISEAQRFTAALLANQSPARGAERAADPGRPVPSLPRSITPT